MATMYYRVRLKKLKGTIRMSWTKDERDQLRHCKEYTNEPRCYYTITDAKKFFDRLPADLKVKCEIDEFHFT